VRQRALEIEEALRTAELELAPLALAKAAKGMGRLTMGDTAEEGTPASEKRPSESSRDRRWRSDDREEAQEQGQAYAVAAPVAASRPARSGRRPGAECTFRHKVDSHTEDEPLGEEPAVETGQVEKAGRRGKARLCR
jgi:hypothetical protein